MNSRKRRRNPIFFVVPSNILNSFERRILRLNISPLNCQFGKIYACENVAKMLQLRIGICFAISKMQGNEGKGRLREGGFNLKGTWWGTTKNEPPPTLYIP